MSLKPTFRPLLAILLVTAACGHSESYTATGPEAASGPFVIGTPTRLTYASGMDLLSGFSPDGKTLLYSFQDRFLPPPAVPARPDFDRCIGLLPAGGGTRQEICRADFAGDATTDAFEHAALGTDGALLYGAYSSGIRAPLVSQGSLRLATLAAPWPGRVLLTTPTVIGGFSFDHFGTPRWLSTSTFYVPVHDQSLVGSPDNEVKVDTIAFGIGILRGDLTANGVVFTAVAGSDSASGFDFSAGRDSLYLTRFNDPTLYRIPITGGVRQVVYTSPPVSGPTILRDPVRVGNRIAAVRHNYQRLDQFRYPDPPVGLGPDAAIIVIDPSLGTASTLVAAPGRFRVQGSLAAFGALAASPDGCRLVVEHRIVQEFTFTTDLYSYCLGPAGQCICS
ncbi:MAG: hypothetical protein ABJC19_02565 [Gemmatimonadota bacterium]